MSTTTTPPTPENPQEAPVNPTPEVPAEVPATTAEPEAATTGSDTTLDQTQGGPPPEQPPVDAAEVEAKVAASKGPHPNEVEFYALLANIEAAAHEAQTLPQVRDDVSKAVNKLRDWVEVQKASE
jgi:hypothetical protein